MRLTIKASGYLSDFGIALSQNRIGWISSISGQKIEFDISSHANGVAIERSRGKTDPLHYVYCAPRQTVRQSSDDFDTRKPAVGHEKGAENDRSLEPIDTCDFRIFHYLFVQYCYRF